MKLAAARSLICVAAMLVFAGDALAQRDTVPDERGDSIAMRRRIALERVTEVRVVENDTMVTEAADVQDAVRRKRKSGNAANHTRHIGRMYFDIPEYHDEQQFPISASAYGPMVYVYASPFLGQFRHMSDISEQGKYGAFAALIDVDAPLESELPAPYRRLALNPGVNCLWLANPAGSPTGWTAYVTRGDALEGCRRPEEPSAGAPPIPSLSVVASGSMEFGHADYPAVARISEARFSPPDVFGQPLIGVKCLAAWCEIGPTGFQPRAVLGGATGRFERIKGWHDEQLLAMETGGSLRPAVRATIIPDRSLERYGVRSFLPTDRSAANWNVNWVAVATIVLHGVPPAESKYARWGLRQGENYLFLRRVGPDLERDWQMSVVHQSGGQRHIWTNVTREPHTDVLVPPTARWRFASFDPQGVWVRCGEACCSGDGGTG